MCADSGDIPELTRQNKLFKEVEKPLMAKL